MFKAWSDIKTQFEFKDQYGDIVEVVPYITISGLSSEPAKATTIQFVDAKKNGTADVQLKAVGAGTSTQATLKFTFQNSAYIFDQNVTLKK